MNLCPISFKSHSDFPQEGGMTGYIKQRNLEKYNKQDNFVYTEEQRIPKGKRKKNSAFTKGAIVLLSSFIGLNILGTTVKDKKPFDNINIRETSIATTTKNNIIIDEPEASNSKNHIIEDSKQGRSNDCWLLAVINSLNKTEKGQEFFKDLLEYNGDETIVHLHVGDYTINDNEMVRGRNYHSKGDDDVLIIELAVEKALEDYNEGKVILPKAVITDDLGGKDTFSTLNMGSQDAAIYILTGKSSEYLKMKTKEDIIDFYIEKFKTDERENMSVTASVETDDTYFFDENGKKITLKGHHAYTVKSISDDNIVTIINPIDSQKEIEIDLESFKNTFSSVTVADISDIA